jgi:hypothetical protein
MRFVIAGCSLVALAGCEALGPYAPDYGDAVYSNIAAQSVQPPPPAAQPVPGNGETAALAQDRYAKDKVKPPVGLTTSNVSSGSSGGTPVGNP